MTNPNALKTIGEVSRLIEVPIYVLRFWEKKFKLVVPIKKKQELDIMMRNKY